MEQIKDKLHDDIEEIKQRPDYLGESGIKDIQKLKIQNEKLS
jgi:hypothetical protein